MKKYKNQIYMIKFQQQISITKERVMQQNDHQSSRSQIGRLTVSIDLDTSKRSLNKTSLINQKKELLMTFKNKSENNSKSLSKKCSRFKKSEQKNKSNQKSVPKSKQKNKKLNKTVSQNSPMIKKQNQKSFDQRVRKMNKKYISRENSVENLHVRLPWGVDEPRLNNYVLETLSKMQKLKKTKFSRKQQTFNTQRSQTLKQSEIKLQLTPKKRSQFQNSKMSMRSKDKIIKSPLSNEKTYKKSKSKLKPSEEQNKTQKQNRNNQDNQPILKKKQNLSEFIYRSLNGQFQCLQKNNLYQVNFRIVNKKIIEIEVAIFKKAQSLTVNLCKGSLECQSINQTYKQIMPKSSIILMSGVSGTNKKHPYVYPELQVILNEKNGSFALQKKILIPYSEVFLIEIIPANFLKDLKMKTKIRNKSVIEQIAFKKQILQRLEKIFENSLLKLKNKQCIIYQFGFKYNETVNLIRLMVSGAVAVLECQSCVGANTAPILEIFQTVLGI